MNAAERDNFRHEILRQLAVVGPMGMKAGHIKQGSRAAGFEPTDPDVDAALDYLAGKGLVVARDKTVSPEMAWWKLTAEGSDYVAKEKLA